MPTDVAGRFRQDCGVYALQIADELHQVGVGYPNLNLEFDLYVMPEHVSLVIFENDKQYYVANNDHIAGPFSGDRGSDDFHQKFAEAYGNAMGIKDIVTPAASVTLGTTDEPSKGFRKQAWSRYKDATSGWGLSGTAFGYTGPDHLVAARAYQDYVAFRQDYALIAGKLRPELDTYHAIMAAAAERGGAPEVEKVLRETIVPELIKQAPSINSMDAPIGQLDRAPFF